MVEIDFDGIVLYYDMSMSFTFQEFYFTISFSLFGYLVVVNMSNYCRLRY